MMIADRFWVMRENTTDCGHSYGFSRMSVHFSLEEAKAAAVERASGHPNVKYMVFYVAGEAHLPTSPSTMWSE